MLLDVISKNSSSFKIASLFICTASNCAVAGDVNFKPSVEVTGYTYETKRYEDEDYQSNQAVVIQPSLLGSYTSKKLSASLSADHTLVEQDLEDADKNYTEFKYLGNLVLVDNALNLSFNGGQNYRVLNPIQSDISDKVLSVGDLTKSQRNSVTLNFTIPNPKYFGLNLQSSIAKTKTDESTEALSNIALDNTSTSSFVRIHQGSKVRGYTFDFSAQTSKTQRQEFDDFKSNYYQGTIGLGLFKNANLIIVGNLSEYDFDQDNFGARRAGLDTESYGAGFEWTPSSNRSLKLTYNQLDENNNKTEFIGLNTNWNFSQRTKMKLDIGKKFYGDSYDFNFSHSLKRLKTSINYSEEVTTFAALDISSSIGLFVCEFGSTEFSSCFQPSGSSYELKPGEEFRVLQQFQTDITEEVIFRKSGSLNIGYDKRKVKLSASVSYGKTEYLETNRVQNNRGARFNLNYKLGQRSSIGLSGSLIRRTDEDSTKADTIKNVGLSFERQLNQNLNLSIDARLLDRDSEDLERIITDRRLTIGLKYTL